MKIIRLLIAILVLAVTVEATAANKLDDLMTSLQTTLAKSPDNAGQVGQFLGMVKTSIAEGNLTQAEMLLAGLKSNLPAGREQAGPLIDQILAELRSAGATQAAAVNTALDPILGDLRAKMVARAPAKDFDILLARLAKVNVPRNTYGDSPASVMLNQTRDFVARWQDYLTQSDQGNFDMATNTLNALVNMSSALPIVPRSELLAIQAQNVARAAAVREQRLSELRQRFADLKRREVAVLDTAQTAADLDSILSDLSPNRFGDANLGYSPELREMQTQAETMRRLALRWQDYLTLRGAGSTVAALEILRSLANDGAYDDVFPRSRILERINGKDGMAAIKPERPPDIAPDALTLETVDQLAEQLGPPRATGGYAGVLSGVVQVLSNAKLELKNGNPQPAVALLNNGNFGQQTAPYTSALVRIKTQLVMAALPGYLRAPDGFTPAADETLPAYLSRLLKRANETQDWPLAYRVLMVVRSSPWEMPGSDLSLDVASYAEFFAGLNMEKTGQVGPAVRSYLDSLRVAGPDLPREEIGRRLRQLKQDHPKDVEAAESPIEPPSISSPHGTLTPTELQAMRMRLQNMSTAFPAPPGPEPRPAEKSDPPDPARSH